MTEIIGRETILHEPTACEADFRRLEELNLLLTTIERWYEVFHQIPVVNWIGIPFGIFDQFSHCLIKLLFKLSTLDEPGWNTTEARRRVNMLDILESLAQGFEDLPEAAGLVDGMGDSGVFFRAPPIIRAMKDKFAEELTPVSEQEGDSHNNIQVSEDFAMYFADEPWLPEMFGSLWDIEMLQ